MEEDLEIKNVGSQGFSTFRRFARKIKIKFVLNYKLLLNMEEQSAKNSNALLKLIWLKKGSIGQLKDNAEGKEIMFLRIWFSDV